MRITHQQIKAVQSSLFKAAMEYATTPRNGRTLVLFGSNGTGKTRLLKRFMYWANSVAMLIPLVIREDLECQIGLAFAMFSHWPSVVDEFQKTQADSAGEVDQCNLWLVDDLGAEHDPSGYGSEQFYLHLNRREFKWNIITTNYAPGQWKTKFEPRIASRLFRNAEHLDMSKTPDFSTT